MIEKKVFFPGLNGIRAIAVSIVYFFHLDQFMYLFGQEGIGYHQTGMAGFAVVIFFVLSGFLITSLLLLEKQKFTKISYKKFYIRRILRIWPIYYIAIFYTIALLVLNYIPYKANETIETLILYSILLSNVGYSLNLGLITITPLWSIGVEEQFYLLWPYIINKSKDVMLSFLKFILFFIVLKILIYLGYKLNFKGFGTLYSLIGNTLFDTMAVGGAMAWLVFSRHKLLLIVFNPILQVFSWLFLLFSIFYKPIHIASLFDMEIHAFFYSIIIANVASNPKTIISLENSLFNFIGRISYGIYVYHMLIIFLSSIIIINIFKEPEKLHVIYIYIINIFITLLISYLSYRYFESLFLKMKDRFSIIPSTN